MSVDGGNEKSRSRSSSESGGEAHERTGIYPQRRRWIKYAVGAALVFGICVLYGGMGLSNDFSSIVQLGLIMGPFLFLFLGPAHFAFQFVTRWLITRFWQPQRMVDGAILNLPALGVFIFCFVSAAAPWTPSRMLEALQKHFDYPLPASVQVKNYRMMRGLNEGTYAFAFRINPAELSQFLSNSGYSLIDSNEVELVMLRVKAVARAAGSIDAPFAIYRLETNRGITRFTKTILVDSNRTDLLLYEDFH